MSKKSTSVQWPSLSQNYFNHVCTIIKGRYISYEIEPSIYNEILKSDSDIQEKIPLTAMNIHLVKDIDLETLQQFSQTEDKNNYDDPVLDVVKNGLPSTSLSPETYEKYKAHFVVKEKPSKEIVTKKITETKIKKNNEEEKDTKEESKIISKKEK